MCGAGMEGPSAGVPSCYYDSTGSLFIKDREVVPTIQSKEDLIESILRSCTIPIFTKLNKNDKFDYLLNVTEMNGYNFVDNINTNEK